MTFEEWAASKKTSQQEGSENQYSALSTAPTNNENNSSTTANYEGQLSISTNELNEQSTVNRNISSCNNTNAMSAQRQGSDNRQVSSPLNNRQYSEVNMIQNADGTETEERVTYVEVPVVSERDVFVKTKEIHLLDREVPKIEIREVETCVEVPEIHIIDKEVEVPFVEIRTIRKPKLQVIEVPKEVVKTVPKIIINKVEHVREVPGDTILVPKPYNVERPVDRKLFHDSDVPCAVAQVLHPRFRISRSRQEAVECANYKPVLVRVPILVPKIVSNTINVREVKRTQSALHSEDIPAPQWNALLKMLNPHMCDTEGRISSDLPVRSKNPDGTIPVLGANGRVSTY